MKCFADYGAKIIPSVNNTPRTSRNKAAVQNKIAAPGGYRAGNIPYSRTAS